MAAVVMQVGASSWSRQLPAGVVAQALQAWAALPSHCRLLARAFFCTKRLTGRLPRWLRWPLMPLLRWFSGKRSSKAPRLPAEPRL